MLLQGQGKTVILRKRTRNSVRTETRRIAWRAAASRKEQKKVRAQDREGVHERRYSHPGRERRRQEQLLGRILGRQRPASAAADKPAANDEKTWRDKFATLRHKLEQDQAELDVMQRELGVLNVQYYSDPVKAMQQQFTRSDINKKTADIDAKKERH